MGQKGYDAERHGTQSSWESRHPKIISDAAPAPSPFQVQQAQKSKCDPKSLSRQETQDYKALLAFLMLLHIKAAVCETGDGSEYRFWRLVNFKILLRDFPGVQ